MDLNYMTDKNGQPVAIVIPIEEWESIRSRLDRQAEEETSYLLSSPVMRDRLVQAKSRTGGKTLDQVQNALGL